MTAHPPPAIFCLTARGLALAKRIQTVIGGAIHGARHRTDAPIGFARAGGHLRALFTAGTPVIGICASGILIRALAPCLGDKSREPPVLALSEDGRHVVPLLGGHRGANELARRLAEAIGASCHTTTAGETAFGVALDAPPAGWRLGNPERARDAMAALLAGAAVVFRGEVAPPEWLAPLAARAGRAQSESCVSITLTEERTNNDDGLLFHPTCLAMGVGCVRGCDSQELIDLAERCLQEARVAPGALAGIVSVALKADEPAIHALAAYFDLEAGFFSAQKLEEEAPRLVNPSPAVFAEVGCHGVAEGAALAACGAGGTLVLPKRMTARATCAIARAQMPITRIEAAPRGRLFVVGIGPGGAPWRTLDACRAIGAAEEIVGYTRYLQLLDGAIAGKETTPFSLGQERERCAYALERAGEGRTVALISSGDSGIYAMGSLVMELRDRAVNGRNVSDAARRVAIELVPGISAMQAASARMGALLGHDFCAISLSDLLTPWPAIESRLKAAAEGDFVTALYNPASRKRRWQLGRAREIFLAHRPPGTPVLIAANLGRKGEAVRVETLERLQSEAVGMTSIVLFGARNSRLSRDGAYLYTPRGYESAPEREVAS